MVFCLGAAAPKQGHYSEIVIMLLLIRKFGYLALIQEINLMHIEMKQILYGIYFV
jgi:hypothetical protein